MEIRDLQKCWMLKEEEENGENKETADAESQKISRRTKRKGLWMEMLDERKLPNYGFEQTVNVLTMMTNCKVFMQL